MPTSLNAIVSIGWLERDAAVRFLQDRCNFVPTLTEAEAEAQWLPYRQAVEALGTRQVVRPATLPLENYERTTVRRCMQEFRRAGFKDVLDIVKIDPMGLVVRQLDLVLDQAQTYVNRINSPAKWERERLSVLKGRGPQINISPGGLNTILIELPHGEFMFLPDQAGAFRTTPNQRYVSISELSNRLVLWAGYHRTYLRMVSVSPTMPDRSLLMVLTTNAAPAGLDQSMRTIVAGPRPPFFGDFFEDRFCMRVPIKKTRFRFKITVELERPDA
jgi:hypothetical protein